MGKIREAGRRRPENQKSRKRLGFKARDLAKGAVAGKTITYYKLADRRQSADACFHRKRRGR